MQQGSEAETVWWGQVCILVKPNVRRIWPRVKRESMRRVNVLIQSTCLVDAWPCQLRFARQGCLNENQLALVCGKRLDIPYFCAPRLPSRLAGYAYSTESEQRFHAKATTDSTRIRPLNAQRGEHVKRGDARLYVFTPRSPCWSNHSGACA